jgi:sugar-specific transcriptional regulator TrmB
MYTSQLTQLGLTPEQAELYHSLLEKGPQSATQLAKSTSVKRTYVYPLCRQLLEQNLITQTKHARTTVFTAQTPDRLLDLAQSQKQKIDQAQKTLESILPDLNSLYTLSENKPIISYFEGPQGIKRVYEDTLKVAQPISALLDTTDLDPKIRDWLKNIYSPKRAKLNIPAKVILSTGDLAAEYQSRDQITLRETRLISRETFPLHHEINIYGSKLAIMHHKKDEDMIGIIIDHPLIARTMQSWFDLAWLSANEISR